MEEKEMLYDVIRKMGFENPRTIAFAGIIAEKPENLTWWEKERRSNQIKLEYQFIMSL